MPKRPTRSIKIGPAKSAGPIIDMHVLVAISACAYVSIISPLLLFWGSSVDGIAEVNIMTAAPRPENKIFWPIVFLCAVVLMARNFSRLALPPHIICLLAYLGLAGVSVIWAFNPGLSFQRFLLQAMILTTVVLPIMLAPQSADAIRGLFLCFAFACFLNIPFVANQNPIILENVSIGYPGYFSFKGLLGQCAAITILLALHEMLYPGRRRVLGIIVFAVAAYLAVISKSKGALGMAIIAPIIAGFVLLAGRRLGVSPTLILLPIPIAYWVVSKLIGNLIGRISWHLFGNYDLSGRVHIWDFVNYMISLKPVLGWGYQSFWLAGPDAPSIAYSWGWIKTMPHAHNGYLDTIVEMGYVGLAVLVVFIFTTVHAIGHVANRDPRRGWLLLSFALFVILTNFLESIWMRGMDMLWLLFAIVAAESARYWQPSRSGRSRRGPGPGPIARERGTPGQLPQAVRSGARR